MKATAPPPLQFEPDGSIIAIYTDDTPDRLVARVDSDGSIHVEDDAPEEITEDRVHEDLYDVMVQALETHEMDWMPAECHFRAVGWTAERQIS